MFWEFQGTRGSAALTIRMISYFGGFATEGRASGREGGKGEGEGGREGEGSFNRERRGRRGGERCDISGLRTHSIRREHVL